MYVNALSRDDEEQILSVSRRTVAGHVITVNELCDAVVILGRLADINVDVHDLLRALEQHNPVAWAHYEKQRDGQ